MFSELEGTQGDVCMFKWILKNNSTSSGMRSWEESEPSSPGYLGMYSVLGRDETQNNSHVTVPGLALVGC